MVNNEHTRKKALNDYKVACNQLLRLFCAKHEYGYDPTCWVGNEPGGIACIGDYFIDMQTIITDIKMEAPASEFIDWYDYCVDAEELGLTSPNYMSWLKGCPRIPDDKLQRLRDIRTQLFEETEKLKNEFK